MNYLRMTIVELHNELVKKTITPLELAKLAIEKAKNDTNNAFEYICEKEALEFAATLTEPEVDNYLWGIPYVAKDNISTKDIPTTGSSNILNGYVPIYDAAIIERLKERKAVLIGKTTLDELAMGGSGMSGHLGYTYNPYDKSHTHQVGGSSAGSAAACSAPIVPFALGSDTGDSIRKPASYAGLVGLKPSWGRISRWGLFPFAPSMDHVGYFTRSVVDSAILLDVLAGRDERDSTSSSLPVVDYLKNINSGLKGKKIVIIKEIVESISNKNIRGEFDKLIKSMEEKGAEIIYRSIDKKLLEAIFPTYIVLSCSEATSNNANLDGVKFGPFKDAPTYQEEMMRARSEGFSSLIKRRFVIGSFSLMSENQNELFLRAKKARRLIVNALNDVMKDCDAVVVPAAPSVAAKFDGVSDKLSDEYLIADNHMALGNFAGLPSMTVPYGFEDKLPFGVNVMSNAFDEANLFSVAKGIEDITGYYNLNAEEVK